MPGRSVGWHWAPESATALASSGSSLCHQAQTLRGNGHSQIQNTVCTLRAVNRKRLLNRWQPHGHWQPLRLLTDTNNFKLV